MQPCRVPASSLHKSSSLAHIGLPIGPNTYFPQRDLLNALLADATNPHLPPQWDVLKQLRCFQSAWTFQCPPRPEEAFTRANLDMLFNLISSMLASRVTPTEDNQPLSRFAVQTGGTLATHTNFVFASVTTKPEPVLVFRYNGFEVGLIASEAKSLTDSVYAAMAQGVQMAADLAVTLPAKVNIPPNEVVVPFILHAGDSVQFGAVYLIDVNFPCTVLLSQKLTIMHYDHQHDIARWIVALVEHCLRISALLEKHGFKAEYNAPVVVLKSAYFYKAIDATESEALCSKLFRLMQIYNLLYTHEPARARVAFPVGVVGFADANQKSIRAMQEAKVKACLEFAGKSPDTSPPSDGHPILVLDDLCTLGWVRADTLTGCKDYELKEAFLSTLATALQDIVTAGIVHLDVRLMNIFYKVVDNAAAQEGVSMGVSSGINIDIGSRQIEVILVDWDDALRVGEILPSQLIAGRRDDIRFPREEWCEVAVPEYHSFFLEYLRNELLTGSKRSRGSPGVAF